MRFILIFFLSTLPLHALTVQFLDGHKKEGDVRLEKSNYTLTHKGKSEKLDLKKIYKFNYDQSVLFLEKTVRIHLVGGSIFTGKIKSGSRPASMVLKHPSLGEINVEEKYISLFEFGDLDLGSRAEKTTSKSYALMRSGQVVESSLEWFTFLDVGIKTVAGRLKLKKNKLAKFFFNSDSSKESKNEGARVLTRYGDILHGSVEGLTSEGLTLKTVCGTFKLSRQDLVEVEFLSKNLKSLLELKPSSIKKVPYLDFIREPAFEESLFGRSLIIGGRRFSCGIAMHSRTTILYDLGKKYKRLYLTIGMDTSITDIGHAELIFKGDGKVIHKFILDGKSGASDESLVLDQVKELSITLDYGEGGSSGDYVILGHPMLAR